MGKKTDLQPATAPKPGIYYVRLDPCPRRIIETGLPAGEAAEALARDRYLRMYNIVPRPQKVPTLELLE